MLHEPASPHLNVSCHDLHETARLFSRFDDDLLRRRCPDGLSGRRCPWQRALRPQRRWWSRVGSSADGRVDQNLGCNRHISQWQRRGELSAVVRRRCTQESVGELQERGHPGLHRGVRLPEPVCFSRVCAAGQWRRVHVGRDDRRGCAPGEGQMCSTGEG